MLDGSAAAFVDAVLSAGRQTQRDVNMGLNEPALQHKGEEQDVNEGTLKRRRSALHPLACAV
jgi:hypothetical protein